jgi:predicted AAA+ superfamily ATPase
LYINTNNFYVQNIGISAFAGEFYHNGGKVLLIDQVFKQPDWSHQLRECYDRYPGLRIIFTGSSVMRLKEENPELNGIVDSYNLRGFSFREFYNLRTGQYIPAYKLEDILEHHVEIAKKIVEKGSPRTYFQEYLHHGFYPFFLEKTNYSENLLKTMNMMIEVDVLQIKQIELKYLPKIKQLFYKLAVNGHKAPNISKLALDIETSRATVMNYIKYLKDARLLNLIYPVGEEFPKKPAKVILHNTNLMYAIYPFEVQKQEAMETFFINSLWKDHKVNLGSGKNPSYIVDGNYKFQIVDAQGKSKTRMSPDVYYARYNTEVGKDNQLPLWLFGFLY